VLKSQNKSIKFKIPYIGDKKRILNLAINNSKYNIDHDKRTLSDSTKTLENLKEKLNLTNLPTRIECYDISNIQGTDPVGSMVVFENGIPKKSEYRRYKIKLVKQIDDYSMMSEMLSRRLNRLNKSGNHPKPDLILIDGGIGHLSATYKVVLDSSFPEIPIASIAKKHEYIYIPNSNKPLNIEKLSNEGILLQQLRDEAHRFAIEYHRKLRSKRSLDHPLQKIDGIGPILLKRLLVKYKSIDKVKSTHYKELLKIDGINSSLAKKILIELKK
jgi:excinuclease ABC subunit C